MSAKKSSVAAVAAVAAAVVTAKPTFVQRAVEAKVQRGQTVYLYGATGQAQGVPTAAGVTTGPAYATYTPRTAQAACWAWFTAGGNAGSVAAIKASAKDAGHGGQIAAMLRHAARMGAITITA